MLSISVNIKYRKMGGIRLILCAVFHLTMTGVSSGDIFTSEQLQKLDDYISAVMLCRNVPGLTLAVVQGDQVLTRPYGKADLEKDVDVTPDSIFCIGSLTKAMTSALLSKLVPQKFPKTVWDTKLTDILGDSFTLDPEGTTKDATLKDILCHRTGKIRGDAALIAGFPYTVTRAEMSKRLFLLPAFAPFRYQFGYNNWMYFLAGYVAEVLTDEETTWEELTRKNIFQPLGMDSTIFTRDLKSAPDDKLAIPYTEFNGEYHRSPLDLYRLHPAEPAGAVCSTGNDMSKWIQFVLQTGNAPPLNDVVNAKAFAETMQPYELTYSYSGSLYQPTFPVDFVRFGYGFGWNTAIYRGHHMVSHGGSLLSYTSLLYLYPDLKSGLYISINGQDQGGDSKTVILYYLSDLLLGKEPWLNSTTACTFPEPWRNIPQQNSSNATTDPVYQPQRPLPEYIGTYGHKLFGEAHVSINKSTNVLQVKIGVLVDGVLVPTVEKDVFSWEATGLYWSYPKQLSKLDRFHFYSSHGHTIDMLNITVDELMHFDRNIKFEGSPILPSAPSGAMRSASYALSFLVVLVTMTCNYRHGLCL